MKIFLFGSTGMLGSYIYKYLTNQRKKIICIKRNEIDISQVTIKRIEDIFKKYSINEDDIIINCAGIIPQSITTDHENMKIFLIVNSLFPILLDKISLTYKTKVIHITTDCVFNGKKGNYIETDKHDETNIYGISKSLGENSSYSTIIRTSIIGEENKNKYSLLEWVKKHSNSNLEGYINHFWNGVTCLELSKIINKMIDDNIWWIGVRHIFSPNSVSKFELINCINKIYDLNNRIFEKYTKKTVNKTLSSIYNICNTFNIPNIEYQLEEQKLFIL